MTKSAWQWVAIGSMPFLLSGCVAAVIPAVAGSMMAGAKLRHKAQPIDQAPTATAGAPTTADVTPLPGHGDQAISGSVRLVPTGLHALPRPGQTSGDAAPSSDATITAADFVNFALEQAKRRPSADPAPSVVLVADVDVSQPRFIACRAGEPLAVMIDIDPAGAPITPDMPIDSAGLSPEALAGLRSNGVTIIWLSGRPLDDLPQVQSQLVAAGLMNVAQDTLSLTRDAHDRKQLQRIDLAKSQCILAIAGHKRSDFDELFDYVRQDESTSPLKSLWNHGWFLPTPKQ